MRNKRFGYEEMREYILGRLAKDEAKQLEQAMESDPLLKEMYNDLNLKKDLLLYHETVTVPKERRIALRNRINSARLNPIWAPGQVWQLYDFGWLLILNTNELYQCRGILLSRSIQFSGRKDLLFTDDTISSVRLSAFVNHICTVNPEHLTRYAGNINSEAFVTIGAAVSKKEITLPNGITYGGEVSDPEAEIWHEYISEVLNQFTAEALETYENAGENQKLILDLISPHHSFGFSEPVMSSMRTDPDVEDFVLEDYEMNAAAEDFDGPENITLHKGDGIKVEATFDYKHSAVKLIFTFIADDQIIKTLDLKQESVSIFSSEDILIRAQMAECLISDKAVLARLAVLPLVLIITTDKTAYTIKLDVRKS